MFAGAVVVEGRRGLPRLSQRLGGPGIQGPVGAAEQVAGAEAAAGEEVRGPARVLRRAAVRGADQGHVRRRQAEAAGGAGQQQRQALEGLGRRAQEGRGLGIPLERHQAALGRDGRHGPEMPGLRPAVADDRGERDEGGGQRFAAMAAATES